MEVSTRSDPCLICGGPTKGLHFQVSSCRACAAFFRRSVQADKEYKCQGGDGRCDLTVKEKGKTLCRYCRMIRCKQFGMKLDKDSDRLPKLEVMEIELPTASIHKSFQEINVAPPSIDQITGSHKNTEKLSKLIIDMKPVDSKIREILGQPISALFEPRLSLTFMQQLCFGFTKFYEAIRPKGAVVVTNEFDILSYFAFQEKYMIELAKMLMCCDRFASLPFEDKFLLYKNIRPIFQNLERHWSSALLFKTDYDDWRLLHDDKTAIDFTSMRLKFKDVDSETFNATAPLWIPIRDKNIKFLMCPMKTLQLTEYEIVFLLAHILWTVQDINGLSENAIRISEEITEQIASELHNYYAYEMRLSNYAPRLVKITKLIDAAKEIRHAKQDMWTIAKIFDMFRFEIVGSELIEL